MPSHRLQVLIPPRLDSRLRRAAERAQVSRGAWVRSAIEERLEREAGPPIRDPLGELARLNGPTADICAMISEIEAGRS